ncbi:MAG: DUF4935 domain-containing protein [Gammaproteobacteria bacterium]|nr:DUF4935 domain-containing protein [Gammaproteobacteria bacterium]
MSNQSEGASEQATLDVQPLETRHIFIDTQQYRQANFDLERETFKALGEHIEAGRLVLHITNITLAEIDRQLEEYASTVAAGVAKTRAQMKLLKHRAPIAIGQRPSKVDAKSLADDLSKTFRDTAFDRWLATEHDATSISAFDVFKAYFARKPPFAKEGSKEFPDAFVISKLDAWCAANNERMYVVGEDAAMADAARATKTLIAVPTLVALLKIAAVPIGKDVRKQLDQLLAQAAVLEKVGEKVGGQLGNVGLIYLGDRLGGEVVSAEVNGLPEVTSAVPVSASGDHIGAAVKMIVPLSAEISYESTEDAYFDQEDKRWVGAEAAETEIATRAEIEAFVSLSAKSLEVTGVEILSRDLWIEEEYETYK